MVDGNMTADQQRPKWGAEDIMLNDGTGHFVMKEPFDEHCKNALNMKSVSGGYRTSTEMILSQYFSSEISVTNTRRPKT